MMVELIPIFNWDILVEIIKVVKRTIITDLLFLMSKKNHDTKLRAQYRDFFVFNI